MLTQRLELTTVSILSSNSINRLVRGSQVIDNFLVFARESECGDGLRHGDDGCFFTYLPDRSLNDR
jgi:hypothetical protein